MTNIDWTFLAKINLWQVAIVIVALYVVIHLLMRFWPWLRKAIALTDALGQLPSFITRTDESIRGIHKEITRNHGSSLKDAQIRTENAVERIELGVKGLYERADAADAADTKLRADWEDTLVPKPRRTPPRKKEQQ